MQKEEGEEGSRRLSMPKQFELEPCGPGKTMS
jgi:hypothetical protein